MISFPNAKINIGLNVINKRSDGFHSLESIFYPIPLKDVLELRKSTSFSVKVDGIPIPMNDSGGNLVEQAFLLLQKDFKIESVDFYLLKNIPMGAGLGGGSSDGAFALKMLNDYFQLNLTQKKLENYSSFLGSDCPFFIKNRPSFVTGRGEIMEDYGLDLSGKFLVLIKPDIFISTKIAFSGLTPNASKFNLRGTKNLELDSWKMFIKNDFEEHLFRQYPVLEFIKKELYFQGAFFASLSGSGSTMFGLFEHEFPNIEPIPNFEIYKIRL